MFEERVLKKLFRPKRDKVRDDWRKLHNEEPHDLWSSPTMTRIIEARRMRWTGYIA
jgi:hypothetical protein